MMRKPHPAKRARIATLGISLTAFVSVAASMTANAQQAELAANELEAAVAPVELVVPSATPVEAIVPAASPKVTQPAPVTTTKPKTKKPKAKKTVAPATPSKSTAPAVAPTKAAATVVYTCMSPGGKTENPTSKGKCKNAKYGYVLTKI
jgi:hypothetical protein